MVLLRRDALEIIVVCGQLSTYAHIDINFSRTLLGHHGFIRFRCFVGEIEN